MVVFEAQFEAQHEDWGSCLAAHHLVVATLEHKFTARVKIGFFVIRLGKRLLVSELQYNANKKYMFSFLDLLFIRRWQWCDCRRMKAIYGPELPSFSTLFKFKAHLSYIHRRQFNSRISTLDWQATSPNSFLRQRNVHREIRRKGRICITRRY